MSEDTATLLLENDAHLDLRNDAGQTAADVWMNTHKENGTKPKWDARPGWCRTVPDLLCLTAHIVRVHKIPYFETPVLLHSFIAMHLSI